MWTKETPIKDADIPHYSIYKLTGDGMEALKFLFPEGKANGKNLVLFSTSGVHGSYTEIEEVEEFLSGKVQYEDPDDCPRYVTFLVIQPRLVCMRYGNVKPRTMDDIAFLKRLRDSSMKALKAYDGPAVAV
jgi:hypothetical protein